MNCVAFSCVSAETLANARARLRVISASLSSLQLRFEEVGKARNRNLIARFKIRLQFNEGNSNRFVLV